MRDESGVAAAGGKPQPSAWAMVTALVKSGPGPACPAAIRRPHKQTAATGMAMVTPTFDSSFHSLTLSKEHPDLVRVVDEKTLHVSWIPLLDEKGIASIPS